jgi:hypothetical protein
MARIASNVHLPIREFGIDVFRHCDHKPSDFLGMLFVARIVGRYVTEVALLPQRNRERSHGRNQILVSRQQLQILRRRMLPERSHCKKQCREG